jgi:hypothetical protein
METIPASPTAAAFGEVQADRRRGALELVAHSGAGAPGQRGNHRSECEGDAIAVEAFVVEERRLVGSDRRDYRSAAAAVSRNSSYPWSALRTRDRP